jgi:hypothetical protein
MGTLTGNVKPCDEHPGKMCFLWEWEPRTICPVCGATQTFLHQPESRPTSGAVDSANAEIPEESGLADQLFGFGALRKPPNH